MRNRRAIRPAGRIRSGLIRDAEESSELHEQRLDAVAGHLLTSGAASVLDLGCGSGSLLERLVAEAQFTRLLGVDSSLEALGRAEGRQALAAELVRGRLTLRHASFTTADEGLTGFDAAALVETIEHIPPAHLSRLERAVFAEMRPGLVVMTTPNRDYNEYIGMARGELRQSDHRFEWGRSRFEAWATGVGERNGYRVAFETVGRGDAWVGGPTQLAIMRSAVR